MSVRSLIFVFLWCRVNSFHQKNLAWSGGPLHTECEHGAELWSLTGKYIKDNVIAFKAVTYNDEIYLVTPRLKHGVLATVWQIVRGRRGVELQAYPQMEDHKLGDCNAIQNAVDFYMDHLGNLWILDTGIVETLMSPRCTCSPKVIVISLILGKITRAIDLTAEVQSSSQLQNIIVEYGIGGKAFVYVSDAARGAILVHDVTADSGWTVLVCEPSKGLQIALVKQAPAYTVLIMTRLHYQGLMELDTAALRRKHYKVPLKTFGEQSRPVMLLGANVHNIFFRHTDCSEVLSWNIREPFNTSRLDIHSPGPRMTTTSVTSDHLRHSLLVLDSNYGDTVLKNMPTYHRITFIK